MGFAEFAAGRVDIVAGLQRIRVVFIGNVGILVYTGEDFQTGIDVT